MKLLHSKKALALGFAILFNCTMLLAQKTVTGKVLSNETGKPVEGATVAIKGSKQSSRTNEKGEFTLNVASDNDVLVISFIGLSKQEIKVGSNASFNITMLPDPNSDLDDVVVVGYSTQKRSQSTGAVATIKAQEIADLPAPNIAGALRGRIAGLGVSAASGRPGAGITLNVRNATTSAQGAAYGASDEPLYVIDNIIVGKGTFDALDPSMVEDITVLKDASAAIYGAAGAKGVILITTKRGKAGTPQLNYNGYYGNSDATRKPEMLSAYEHAQMLNESLNLNASDNLSFFSPSEMEYLKGLNNKSWFDEIWQASVTQRHNVNISGGSDRMTFFVGGAYQNENGNYAGMKSDKYTMRSGLTAKLLNGLRAEVNLNVDNGVRYSKNGLNENDQTFLENMIQIPKWVPFSIDGKWVNHNNMNNHPMAQIESGFYRNTVSRNYGINASLIYQPESGLLKGLTARLQASTTGNSNKSEEFRPKYNVYNFLKTSLNGALYSNELTPTNSTVEVNGGNNSRMIYGTGESGGYRVFGTLQYVKKIGLHDFSILAGGEQSYSKGLSLGGTYFNQQLQGFDYFWAFELSGAQVSAPSISESSKRSFFGNFTYNFDGKYTLSGITRFDASSNFAKGNIWGVFPQIGASWLISEENFFKDNVSLINYLKVRANLGVTGDDRVTSRLWQERFSINTGIYMYNESLVSGSRPSVFPNPNITWEKNRSFNFGVEMSLFNNKLNIGVDVFQNYIYDAFDRGLNETFPMYAGFVAPVVNYQNRYAWGSEYSISYNQPIGKDLKLRVGTNFSFGNSVIDRMYYNANKLWETNPDDGAEYTMGTDPRKYTSGNIGLIAEGMFRNQDEVDAFLAKNPGYLINGVVPQPGWLYYKDFDGDGIITARDKGFMYNRIDPWLNTGTQLGLSYKSFAMNINIAASFGGKVFYDSKARRSTPTLLKNVPSFWTDRWSPLNPDGKFPRSDDPSIAAGWESTFWAVDATTIRINDMTISYTVPPKYSKKIGLNSVRVLATGNNLWVLKNPLKYKDPYSSYIYDYPTLRTVSVGLSVGF